MNRPAVFFDRDNTLIINDGYLGDPAKVVLMPGAADSISAVRQLGFAVVTVSNQSGVARGLFNESDVKAVDDRLDQLLSLQNSNATIDLHEYCPFHPEAIVPAYKKKSDLRKPAPGMILLAAKKLDLDLARSWVIGDASRDIEAGIAAGCRTILFTPSSITASEAAKESAIKPDARVSDLLQAVELIRINRM